MNNQMEVYTAQPLIDTLKRWENLIQNRVRQHNIVRICCQVQIGTSQHRAEGYFGDIGEVELF
jgi:hypothetical protein